MPAHRLNSIGAEETVAAVLDALSGTPIHEAANRVSMEPPELEAAIDVFRQAGALALEQQATAPGWWQIYVEFPDWANAEATAATYLAPLLDQSATEWWFIRKHPCWRMRLLPQGRPDSTKTTVGTALDDLTTSGRIQRWWTGVYEPESAAFGGTAGMTTAHRLFHADTQAILARLHGHRHLLGRRELSVLLCTALMRGAGLEWYEQGDVWHQVAAGRPLPADVTPEQLEPMGVELRRLLKADLRPEGLMLGDGNPAAFAAEWIGAFSEAGEVLGNAAGEGRLERGLRQVLAYHVIFHWNRMGLPARAQSILAWGACAAMLDSCAVRASTRGEGHG